MDYKEVQSQKNISSKNVLTQMHGTHGAPLSVKPSAFVNPGLLLWNQGRRKWIGDKKFVRRFRRLFVPRLRSLRLCIVKKLCICGRNVTRDDLLRSKKPFPKPIPLNEMVGFLVDIWEQEGMYD